MIAALLLAATDNAWNYVGAAYAVVIVTLVAYAAFVIARGRKVGRQLPPDERRWL